jgi:hypothetical protein
MKPKYKIIHETNSKFLDSILREGKLLTSDGLNKLNNSETIVGQGSRNRRLCDPEETIKNRETFWKHCDEANGVYFRIFEMDTPLKTFNGDIILIFSRNLLYKYDWILNTTENFGFYISEPGVQGESQFSGEVGTTYTFDTLNKLRLNSFDPYASELCVFQDVSLKYLKEIYVTEPAFEKFKLDIKALHKYSNADIIILR